MHGSEVVEPAPKLWDFKLERVILDLTSGVTLGLKVSFLKIFIHPFGVTPSGQQPREALHEQPSRFGP